MDNNEESILDEIEKAPYSVTELDGFRDPVNRLKAGSKVRSVFGQKRKMARCIGEQSRFLELFPQEKKTLEALVQKTREQRFIHP